MSSENAHSASGKHSNGSGRHNGGTKGHDSGSSGHRGDASHDSTSEFSDQHEDSLNPENDSASSAGTAGAPGSESPLSKLQEEALKFKNDYLYLRAEFENYKKHAIRERADLLKFGSERLARDILSVADNFERALSFAATKENFENFKTGIEMTAKELRSVLQKHGINEVESLDKPFDPAVHEALSSEDSSSPSGQVVRVHQKPYKFHDKILRVGQVVVSRGPKKE